MRNPMRTLMLIGLVGIMLAGAQCRTGDVTKKVETGTVTTMVMAGEMFLLVAQPMDQLCPKALLPLEVCRGWRHFAEGKALRHPLTRQFIEPADAQLCAAPTLGGIVQVLDRCGFVTAYPFLKREYDAKRDVAVAVASAAEGMITQLMGFAKVVNGGRK